MRINSDIYKKSFWTSYVTKNYKVYYRAQVQAQILCVLLRYVLSQISNGNFLNIKSI